MFSVRCSCHTSSLTLSQLPPLGNGISKLHLPHRVVRGGSVIIIDNAKIRGVVEAAANMTSRPWHHCAPQHILSLSMVVNRVQIPFPERTPEDQQFWCGSVCPWMPSRCGLRNPKSEWSSGSRSSNLCLSGGLG